MMASVTMLVGGAIVNTATGTGSQYLFSQLQGSKVDAEWKRHNLAVEQLQAAQAAWSRKRTECLDWINGELRRQGHAVRIGRDVDWAMREYAQVTSQSLNPIGPEPILSDFYTPCPDQKDREIVFVILGMAATGLVAYRIAKK